MTEQELLSYVSADKKEQAENFLKNCPEGVHIGIQIILFIGALLACVMCATGALIFGMSEGNVWIVGLLATGIGYWLLQLSKGKSQKDLAFVFVDFLWLILGMAGRAVILLSVLEELSSPFAESLFATLVAVAGYFFFTHKIDRFSFSAFAVASWLSVLFERETLSAYYWGFIILLLLVFALYLFSRRKSFLRPLAYALLGVGLTATIATNFPGELWCGAVRVLAAGLAAYGISRLKVAFWEKLMLGLATAVLVCSLNFTSFAGLAICVIGYLLRERVVEWAGAASFATGLWYLYFNLSGTLLYKSGCLVGSGLVVLALYAYMRRKYAR